MLIFSLLLTLSNHLFSESYGRQMRKEIVIERIEEKNFDNEYAVCESKTVMVNRTIRGISLNVTVFKDIPDSLEVEYVLNKFSTNEYKRTALSFKTRVCKYRDQIAKILEEQNKYIENWIPHCPIKEGNYYVEGLTPNFLSMPLLKINLPMWKCRLDVTASLDNLPLLQTLVYFSVQEM